MEGGIRPPGGGMTPGGRALDEALRTAAGPDPVRLYVFSNRWFAQATGALAAAGRPWRDLSVPRALRDAADPDAWSPEFLQLTAGHGSEASFRTGLARLLAATPAPLVPDGHVAAGRGGASESSRRAASLDKPSRFVLLSTGVGLSALAAGCALVIWTERSAVQAISCMPLDRFER